MISGDRTMLAITVYGNIYRVFGLEAAALMLKKKKILPPFVVKI